MIEAWEYLLPDQSDCDGCTDCRDRCTGNIPLTQAEYAEIRAYLEQHPCVRHAPRRAVWPGGTGGETYPACRFQNPESGLCAVYPVRPLVCRLFGYVSWLPCPNGRVRANWKPGLAMMKRRAGEEQHTWEEWCEMEGGSRLE